ncbi:hypothetical protein FRC04_003972 [Tulasnella sp. 424]|nr:hypothetical protein FRC04_003972 [Tulasnella sp. 424]KAG8965428.1 hypothetical protein FRC05_003265 [Tulasnella sp. 425]
MSSDPAKAQSPTPVDTTAPKRSRKTRIVRRRGRARDDDIEEDDVIERAALSDTESESSDQEDSASEDEEEEEAPAPAPQASSSSIATATAATLPTPVTEATPPPAKTGEEEASAPAPPKEPTQLWSDAVAEDRPGDGEDLPVIDFAELSTVPQGESITTLLDKKKRKKKKKAKADQSSTPKAPAQDTKAGGPSASGSGDPSPTPAPADTTAPAEASTSSAATPAPESSSEPAPSTSKPPRPVPAYFTARQSYLKKLSSDPAATPRVGQFWGHDDRLMDKELRPMSDWWRERRGRGRGGRGGFVGRGRGGRGGPPPFAGGQTPESPTQPQEERPVEPIDAKWTHDGYEELERQMASGGRGGKRGISRGRGRVRGGGGGGRGGRGGLNGISTPAASSPNPGVTAVQAQLQAQAAAKMASEQHEGGPSTPTPSNSGRSAAGKKAKRAARNPRAKVSDVLAQAVKERETEKGKGVVAAAKSEVAAGQQAGPSNAAPAVNGSSTTTSGFVRVNLPRATSHARAGPAASTSGQATAPTTQETPANPPQHQPSGPRHGAQPGAPSGPLNGGQPKRTETLERAVLKDSFTKAASSAGASDAVASPSTSQPPVTLNAPIVTQPSTNPSYSYVALPPGIAMGESGFLYEIATGRPVMLNPQGTAPIAPTPPLPPPMSAGGHVYNPRPVPHSHVARSGSMSYIPPHVLSSLGAGSATPDSYSATPPNFPGYPGSPVGEQRNGTPTFFAPPKARGRVSIRAPDSGTSESGAQDAAKQQQQQQQQQQQSQQQQQAQSQQTQPQPQTTVVPQSTYAPQPQYPASTSHISEAAHAASYAPPPDQYYNNGYYATPSANPNGYPGVPTIIGGQTYYNQPYYPQPYGYGPGAEYGYAPPADESYAAYNRQQMPGDPNQQQQMQQPHNPSQGYPTMQAAAYY